MGRISSFSKHNQLWLLKFQRIAYPYLRFMRCLLSKVYFQKFFILAEKIYNRFVNFACQHPSIFCTVATKVEKKKDYITNFKCALDHYSIPPPSKSKLTKTMSLLS